MLFINTMIFLCYVLIIESSSSVSPLTQATSSSSTQSLPSRIREKSKRKLTSPIKPIVIHDENDHEIDNHPNDDDDEEYNESSAKKKQKKKNIKGKSPSKTAKKIILPNVISSTPPRASVSHPIDEKKIIQLINNNNKHIIEESKIS